jgi:transposase
VFAAEGVHADETTVPVLAKGKMRTVRLWTFAGPGGFHGTRDSRA